MELEFTLAPFTVASIAYGARQEFALKMRLFADSFYHQEVSGCYNLQIGSREAAAFITSLHVRARWLGCLSIVAFEMEHVPADSCQVCY